MDYGDGWLGFWQGQGGMLFAGDRHRQAHARLLARDYVALLGDHPLTVLDFGPGEGLSAPAIADQCQELLLCEAADGARDDLSRRFADRPLIRVIGLRELALLPAGSIDLIIMHSVLQYVPSPDLPPLLERFATLLRPDGRLLIGDVISPSSGVLADIRDLLGFARRGRFLIPALWSLLRLSLTSYGRYRRAIGLARYDDAGMQALLCPHGFRVARLARNIGHSRCRAAYMACLSEAALGAAIRRAPNRTSDSA